MDLFASNFITDPYRTMINPGNSTPSFVNPYKSIPSFRPPTQKQPPVVRKSTTQSTNRKTTANIKKTPTSEQQAKLERKLSQSKPGTIDVQEEIIPKESTNSIKWDKLYINNDRTPVYISEDAVLPAADYNQLTPVAGGFIDRLLIARGEKSDEKYHIFKTQDDASNFQNIIEKQVALNIQLFITSGYIKIIKNNGNISYYVLNMRRTDKPELYIKSYISMSDAPPKIFNFYTPSPEEMIKINENEKSSFVNNSNIQTNKLFLIFILIIIIIIYAHLSRRNQKNNNLSLTYELT